jgi:hypothetical protein
MPLLPSAPPIEAEEVPYAHSPKEGLHEVMNQVAADRIFAHHLLEDESKEEHIGDFLKESVLKNVVAAVDGAELEEGIARVPSEVSWFLATTAVAGGIDLRRIYKSRLLCKPSTVTLWLDSSTSGSAYLWCSADLRDAGFSYQESRTSFFFHDIVSIVPAVTICLSRRRTNKYTVFGLRNDLYLLFSGLL